MKSIKFENLLSYKKYFGNFSVHCSLLVVLVSSSVGCQFSGILFSYAVHLLHGSSVVFYISEYKLFLNKNGICSTLVPKQQI